MDNVKRTPIKKEYKYMRLMTIGKFPWDHRCRICGQYLCDGDIVLIVYPESSFQYQKDTYGTTLSKLGWEWGVIHKDEFDMIQSKNNTDEFDTLRIIASMPKRRAPKWTESQLNTAEVFRKVCYDAGFRKEPTYKGRVMRIGQSGTSACILFDMITHTIKTDHKGKKNIIDGLYMLQMSSTLKNKFDIAMGVENPTEITTVQGIIAQSVSKVDSIMGR